MTSTNLSLGKGSFEMQTNESWNIKYFEQYSREEILKPLRGEYV